MNQDFVAYAEARTPALLRLAYLLTGDGHHAEDLVQEALTQAYRRWDAVRTAGNPHAYVRRIVVNQHVSWRRRRQSTEVVVAPESMPEGETTGVASGVAERDLAWRAMGDLPARQRAVLVLRYYEDLSDNDIAETLGVAVGTVRSLASRAFAELRKRPELALYDPPGPVPATTTPEEKR